MFFLATFGGVTMQEKHDHHALTAAIPPEFSLDNMCLLRDPAELIAIFIKFLTCALIEDIVCILEVAHEPLGSALSPHLFQNCLDILMSGYIFHGINLASLMKSFYRITLNITAGAGLEFKDECRLFLDQYKFKIGN
jgi:neurofibromin 1